jgi:Tc toxin complex TcA C-terminal TcB-binding domain
MITQLAAMYFQGYKLAYEMAKRTERGYRHDLGLSDSNFIVFGNWDSLKKGLLAGERLHFDLQRMESDYLDKNRREFEIVKHVSLLQHDPLALLALIENGECQFDLPEAIFDLDFPGHYLRRFKSFALTFACVVSSYGAVNCTVTLLQSKIRTTNTVDRSYGETPNDRRFAVSTSALQSVVASQGQNDSGLFEVNFRDERYLPFEGEGVISTFRLSLATQFKAFDHRTISDVVLHLRYTARDGGESLRQAASTELANAVSAFVHASGQKGLARMFSLHDDFPVEWDRFTNPPAATGDQAATFAVEKTRFPLLFQSAKITVSSITLFAKVAAGFEATYTAANLKLTLQAGAGTASAPLALVDWNGLLRSQTVPANAMGNWSVAAWAATDPHAPHQRLDPAALEDVVMVVGYIVS